MDTMTPDSQSGVVWVSSALDPPNAHAGQRIMTEQVRSIQTWHPPRTVLLHARKCPADVE